jgi:hypothetical protein
MFSRADIELDSNAVLAFDDGTRIPCDRFLLRCFSCVVRRLLEDAPCERDERHRVVVPVPCQASAPYWIAVDLLHGCAVAWALSLEEVLSTLACMEYLGVAVHDAALGGRLWNLVRERPLAEVVPHLPRLLRDPALAGAVMRVLIRHRPMWAEFQSDVLATLVPHADTVLINAVVSYAPNFFPPTLVIDWALRTCPHLTQETALRIASQHGVMYHPGDSPVVLRRLAELADGWGGWLSSVLRSVVASMEKYEAVPRSRAHGSIVKFHDIPTASVLLDLEQLPVSVRLAPWLKVMLYHDGRMDVAFKPRKIDDTSRDCTRLQLRVVCLDRTDASACAEAWYLYDSITPTAHGGDTYVLAHATRSMGEPASIARMLRQRRATRLLRLDFFYGASSVLDNPFDPAATALATSNFLLRNATT